MTHDDAPTVWIDRGERGTGYVYQPPADHAAGLWFARLVLRLVLAAGAMCVAGVCVHLVIELLTGTQSGGL